MIRAPVLALGPDTDFLLMKAALGGSSPDAGYHTDETEEGRLTPAT
jgi:hypothetical protein